MEDREVVVVEHIDVLDFDLTYNVDVEMYDKNINIRIGGQNLVIKIESEMTDDPKVFVHLTK